jgi:NAD-dependent dihydropyrimidine dehydrogenase PreA subunit
VTYIIAEPCIDIKDLSCVDVCPVDCIHVADRMLVIDPEECIDCGACVPACPVSAIYDSHDSTPASQKDLIPANDVYRNGDPDAMAKAGAPGFVLPGGCRSALERRQLIGLRRPTHQEQRQHLSAPYDRRETYELPVRVRPIAFHPHAVDQRRDLPGGCPRPPAEPLPVRQMDPPVPPAQRVHSAWLLQLCPFLVLLTDSTVAPGDSSACLRGLCAPLCRSAPSRRLRGSAPARCAGTPLHRIDISVIVALVAQLAEAGTASAEAPAERRVHAGEAMGAT